MLTSERVDRDQNVSDIRLSSTTTTTISLILHVERTPYSLRDPCKPGTYINLSILEPLFQILIYTLVRDGGEQRHIRHTNLLLLEPFLPVGLYPSATEKDKNPHERNDKTNKVSRYCILNAMGNSTSQTHLCEFPSCSSGFPTTISNRQTRARASRPFPSLLRDGLSHAAHTTEERRQADKQTGYQHLVRELLHTLV